MVLRKVLERIDEFFTTEVLQSSRVVITRTLLIYFAVFSLFLGKRLHWLRYGFHL